MIDADRVAHHVLTLQSIKQQLKQTFGSDIFDPQGEIVRSKLASLVFGASQEQQRALEKLEAIVHPEIRQQLESEIERIRLQATHVAIVLDAAVMLESGWSNVCDKIVFVDTPFSTRLQRVQENRNWDEAELTRREASQWPIDRKRQVADAVISNSGNLEQAGRQFAEYLCKLMDQQSPTA